MKAGAPTTLLNTSTPWLLHVLTVTTATHCVDTEGAPKYHSPHKCSTRSQTAPSISWSSYLDDAQLESKKNSMNPR